MTIQTDTALFPVDAADLQGLEERLGQQALAEGLVDVAYRTVDTAVGTLLLAATDKGLVRVAFAREEFDRVLQTLSDRISPRVVYAPPRLDQATFEIEQYLQGKRHDFNLSLDYSLSSGFRQKVQQFLPSIGYGHTASYRTVAEQVGNPRASRAVGTACATNPLPIVIPCHRVLRTDGTLGGYLGGPETKQALLELEYSS